MTDHAVSFPENCTAVAAIYAPQPETVARKGRITELDGLRAFAILPVMMFHLAPIVWPVPFLAAVTQAGWMGVDLFFVLSGFLITSVLISSIKTEHYYRNF